MLETIKSEVINCIDTIDKKLQGTIYQRELKMLRKKYIYKDISSSELKKDLLYLKALFSLTK